MGPPVFGGISFAGEARRMCNRMSTASTRWPFVRVRTEVENACWVGEVVPDAAEEKWKSDESRNWVRGSFPDIGEGALALDCLDIAVRLRPGACEVDLWAGGGLTPLFYARNGGNLVFGTDPTLVCAALDESPALDPAGLLSLFAMECPTPDGSLFEQVRRLPPYNLVVGGPRGWDEARSMLRSFRASIPEVGSVGVEQAVDRLVEAVARSVGDGRGVCLPLTGGVDSRTLLAALPRTGEIRSYTRGTPRDCEVATAAKVAKVAELPHESFPFPDDYLRHSLPRIVHLTGGCVSAQHGHAIHPLRNLVSRGVRTVLPGTNGEFGRAFWAGSRFNGADDATAFWNRFLAFNFRPGRDHAIEDLFRPPWNDAILSAAPDVRRRHIGDLSIDGKVPTLALDWVYAFRRLPTFVVWGPYVWGSAFRVAMPFTDLGYFEAIAGLSESDRRGPVVHRAVMKMRDRRLLRIPLAPSGKTLEHRLGDGWRRRWRRRLNAWSGARSAGPQRYDFWLRRESGFVESVLFADPAADRKVLNIDLARRLWNEHMNGADHTVVLLRLLTVELACRINVEGMSVPWDEPDNEREGARHR